ncbi:hypothetical protein [Sediminibacillus massiliensis]|uniref:hypothetical protein n=1 Tax=Sediminibacillus massiliensis TaxID=1926277 RepID=UPI0009885A7B|nr:hypothetical protein [Sediminibacillus massiliensis]
MSYNKFIILVGLTALTIVTVVLIWQISVKIEDDKTKDQQVSFQGALINSKNLFTSDHFFIKQ